MMLIIVLLTTIISLAFSPRPIPPMKSSSTPNTTSYPKIATSPTTTKLLPKTTTGPQDIFKKTRLHALDFYVAWHNIGDIRAKLRDKRLHILLNKLEKNYEDLGMDAIHEDMVDAWHQIMKVPTIMSIFNTMKKLQIFVEKVVADYSLGIQECIYDDWEDAWNHYIIAFEKKYTTKEKEMRKAIFKKNMENVQKHNVQFDLAKVSYSIKLNHFSDRTPDELKKMKDFRPRVSRPKHPILVRNEIEHYQYDRYFKVPKSFDWRSKGYVAPVKFQGHCCSCYAYAGLGALEASHMKKTGNLVRLSVQNILNCTWDLGNDGCGGGSIHSHAIANYGPVAIGVGTTDDFFNYGNGVFNPSRCGSADHSVLVVSYGTCPVQGDYWIVKNSFGKWWGENGYIRIARNKGNVCGVASHAIFPI